MCSFGSSLILEVLVLEFITPRRGVLPLHLKLKDCLRLFLLLECNTTKRTDRGTKSLKVMKQTADDVINGKIKLCRLSWKYDICKNSFKRFIARYKEYSDKVSPRQIFSLNWKTF